MRSRDGGVPVTGEHVFGTDELDPALLRGVTFTERDGGFDADEVRTFLDRVASALEVYLSGDAQAALRAEFARNAEIAQQVLEAGQSAATQLLAHAQAQAGELQEQARVEAEQLHTQLQSEFERAVASAREQADHVRDGIVRDLRDVHDRLGASLYQLERERADADANFTVDLPSPPLAAAASAEANAPTHESSNGASAALPEGALAPAWQQLPPEAWSGEASATSTESGSSESDGGSYLVQEDPFAVEEDDPLAPGEPLVDLRNMIEIVSSAPTADVVEPASSWLDPDPDQSLSTDDPAIAHDDLMARALIGGDDIVPPGEAPADPAPEAVEASPVAPAADAASADAAVDAPVEEAVDPTPWPEVPSSFAAAPIPAELPTAGPGDDLPLSTDPDDVRRLVLESLAQGQSRETIETYLRERMGFTDPAGVVDAALTHGI